MRTHRTLSSTRPNRRYPWKGITALLLSLGLTAPLPARAFVHRTLLRDGKPVHVRWPDSALSISYVLSDRPLSLLPNLAGDSDLMAAVQGALTSWSVAPLQLRLKGMVSAVDVAQDGRNLITLADTPQNRDIVGDDLARAFTWSSRGDPAPIAETDIVLSPTDRFATNGSDTAFDLQDLLTRELGLALGLGNSPLLASSTYPWHDFGQTYRRTLHTDDLAGVRSLYGVTDPNTGSLTGKVLTTDGTPLAGAHVVATNAAGIVLEGAITEDSGAYSLPLLPPGDYQVYAEPLDGPTTSDDLGSYVSDPRHFFRTGFAGGNPSPATLHVAAGAATPVDPIRAEDQFHSLNPVFIGWSADGHTLTAAFPGPVQIQPGRSAFLAVAGLGTAGVPGVSFSISGSDITIDQSRVTSALAPGKLPYSVLPITVRPGAELGARNLYVALGDERTGLTGAIEVVQP